MIGPRTLCSAPSLHRRRPRSGRGVPLRRTPHRRIAQHHYRTAHHCRSRRWECSGIGHQRSYRRCTRCDRNACTDDSCVDGQCQNTPNDGTCNDELFCNGVEQCVDGECVAGELPCPSADACDEAMGRCTACEDQSHCPAPEVIRQTPCQVEGVCDQTGQNTQTIATYTCTDGACTSTTEDREGMCERDSDGIPCGGGAMCLDGACPRDLSDRPHRDTSPLHHTGCHQSRAHTSPLCLRLLRYRRRLCMCRSLSSACSGLFGRRRLPPDTASGE